MSDNWIVLIPQDPRFVPDADSQRAAADWFASIAPDADEIEIKTGDGIQFFGCGANLERIWCPSCGAELDAGWWCERMEEDFVEDEFRLQNYVMPCCRAKCTLNDLEYDWPQGFARFGLEAMNPNIGELSKDQVGACEGILKTHLRVIYQHI